MIKGKPPTENPPPHGGDVYEIARQLGVPLAELLDFSANLNPLGWPVSVAAAIQEALGQLVHYPDPRCLELRRDLAAYHGLAPEEILVGNGSTELIYLVARALGISRALIVAPAFSEYERALKAARLPFEFYLTSEAHAFTLSGSPTELKADLVILANPASPSGALLGPGELLPWLTHWQDSGALVLLDEAFIDFVEEASLKTHLRRFPRLLILRSFTKFFAIPGLRLGYILGAPEVLAGLEAVKEPWSVNTLAQAAGRACLKDKDFMERTRVLVSEERERLFQALRVFQGLKPFPGAANYLLVKLLLSGWTAGRLRERLLAYGLIIRDASNFVGLDERFFRVAVRRREENNRLLAALTDCLGEA